MNTVLVLGFALLPVLLIGTWKVVNWVWIRPRKLEKHLRDQGFLGSPYKILIGDLIKMVTLLKQAHSKPIDVSGDIAKRVIPDVVHLEKKHGKNPYMWYGPQLVLLIQDHQLVKEASQDINLFHKPEGADFPRLLLPGVGSYNGARWAKHRKLIAPAFKMDKLKNMVPAFYLSTSEMLRKWEEIISPGGWSEVDVWPSLMTLTSDAISRTAFGTNYEQGREIFRLQEEQTDHCFKAVWSSFIPGWRFLPTRRNRRMRKIDKDVDASFMEIINSRMNAVKSGNSCEDDLLGTLLESNSKQMDSHGNKDCGMSVEEVIRECKFFHFAGQESVSVLLVWTMILLARHGEWQSRAREEVSQLFGTDNQPDFDGLNRLKVVNMILHEALRMYPPLPVNGRMTAAETKLGEKTVPAGVLILFQSLSLHYDPEIWGDDVKEFKPDRFSEGVFSASATKGKLAFFPFGTGPRICMGQNYAMLEAKIVVAMILHRFSFELSPSYAHAPRAVLTLKPQYGAHLILRRL